MSEDNEETTDEEIADTDDSSDIKEKKKKRVEGKIFKKFGPVTGPESRQLDQSQQSSESEYVVPTLLNFDFFTYLKMFIRYFYAAELKCQNESNNCTSILFFYVCVYNLIEKRQLFTEDPDVSSLFSTDNALYNLKKVLNNDMNDIVHVNFDQEVNDVFYALLAKTFLKKSFIQSVKQTVFSAFEHESTDKTTYFFKLLDLIISKTINNDI